jgi:Family of unknown function (DUF6221)
MDELVTWLREQVDADEWGAREAADGDSGRWFVGDRWNVYRVEDEALHDEGYAEENRLVVYGNIKAQSTHIVRHNPARTLAEVKAKRLLIHWIERYEDQRIDANNWAMDEGDVALRLLALPYADRPGYREEWALAE